MEVAFTDVIEWLTRVFEIAARPPSIFHPDVFDAFSRAVSEQVPHDRLVLFVREPDSEDVRIVAYAARTQRDDRTYERDQRFGPAREFLAALPQSGLRVVDDTAKGELDFERRMHGLDVGSYVFVPIPLAGDPMAAWLAITWSNPHRASAASAAHIERVARLLRAFVPGGLANARSVRLAEMLDELPHGVIGLDRAGTIIDANRSALGLFGDPSGGLAQRSFVTLLDSESAAACDRLGPDGGAVFVRAASEFGGRSMDVTVSPSHQGGRIARQVHLQDATERLAAEAELNARADALAVLREIAETVAGEPDAKPAVERVIGLLLGRLPIEGAAIFSMRPNGTSLELLASRGIDELLVRALSDRGGTSAPVDAAVRRMDQILATRVQEADRIVFVPLKHAENLLGAALFVTRSTTRPSTKELLVATGRTLAVALHASFEYREALRLATEQRQLLDSVPSIVFRLDSETGATLYANAAVARVLGTPPERALGLPGLEGLLADDGERDAMRATRISVASGAESAWVDRRFSRRDGRVITLRTRLYRVEHPSREASTVIEGIAQDVTEELEARRQLVQADRLASLGTLAAGVAHEINNPTAFISLGVQQLARLLSQMSDDQAAQSAIRRRMNEVLSEVSDGVQRIVQIVGELKLFARIPESAFSTPVDVNRLLTSAVTLARSELRRRARIDVDLGDLPPLPGDHARLGQVFVNLLVNAAQAIPPGNESENVVKVRTRVDGDNVVVEVSDTGVGISPEHLPRIFDPFFTTKPPGEGTGLGLAISFDLVRRANGRIDVESTVGRGTRFTVTLPIIRPSQASVARTSPSPPPPAGTRMLIVEDEQHLGAAMARAFASRYLVELARDAESALERLERAEERVFDIVLCDLRMPKMDGRAFYEAVRKRWPAQAARFVFLTGAAFGGEFESFVRTTERPVLEKPFDMTELMDIVARVAAGE